MENGSGYSDEPFQSPREIQKFKKVFDADSVSYFAFCLFMYSRIQK